jgi:glycosyltransferase involved in cell wall biosynthesis
MSKPLVSIICPTYNHESFIREALDGFVMQKTNFPFEIIVHDDASTDSTAQIVKEYEVEYPHLFNNIYQTVNQFSIEVMSVTKILLNAASGKYIACCEGDDYWTDPYKLQKQVDFLEANEGFSGVFHNQFVINSVDGIQWNFVNKIMDPVPELNQVVTFDDILQGKYRVPTRTILYERELYNGDIIINEKFLIGDLPLAFILTNFKPLFYYNEYMATYRLHENGISNNKDLLDIVELRINYFKTWIIIFDWAYHYANFGKYESYKRGIDRYYKNFIKSNQSIKTNLLIFKTLINLNSKRKTLLKEKCRFVIFQSKSLLLFLQKRMLLNKIKSE